MKIAYICTDFGIPVYGSKGASIHVRELSKAFQSLGQEVMIFSVNAGDEVPSDFDVPVREFGLQPTEKLVYDLLSSDPAAGKRVAKEVRLMVRVNSLRHQALTHLLDFGPDVIYERYSLFGTAGFDLARELGIPLILEVNAPLSEEQAAHRGLALSQTARGLERHVLRSADRVIAVSEELKRWLIDAGVDPGRVVVLPNAVDMARFEDIALQREPMLAWLGVDGQPVVGFLGTLKPWHGTETLIRAVSILRKHGFSLHLLIVGDGPERAGLELLTRHEDIADITTFTGAVPHERIAAHLAAMDVAVAPYQSSERFYFSPLKLFEYMAAGRAVVAADVGQIPDFVTQGITGLLYPPGEVGAMADAIGLLLRDPARASSLGRAGRALVAAEHTWTHRAVQILASVAGLRNLEVVSQ